ncbi:MAG: hypothetical protein IJ561_04005 [Ruminococcus sp.]|nr:hypothetical protein [Ruminococcus sp.]
MTFENLPVTAEFGTGVFSCEKYETANEVITSEIPLLAGGYHRTVLGIRKTLTLEGRYLISKQQYFFRSLVSRLTGGTLVSGSVNGRNYSGYLCEKAVLTERDGEPYGSFLLKLTRF